MLSPKDLLQQLAKIFTKNYKVKTTRFVTSQVEHHRATLHVFAAFVSCCEYIPQHECFFVSYCNKQCLTVVWMLTSVSLLATNVFSSIPLRLHIFKEIALTDLSHVMDSLMCYNLSSSSSSSRYTYQSKRGLNKSLVHSIPDWFIYDDKVR